MKETINFEMSIEKEKLSFGVLMKEREDFVYFQKYVEDNWLQFDACQELHVNSIVQYVETKRSGMFSTEDGIFTPLLLYACGAVCVVCCFGVCYELKRGKCGKVFKTLHVQRVDVQPAKE